MRRFALARLRKPPPIALESLRRKFDTQLVLLPTEYLRQFCRLTFEDAFKDAIATRPRIDLWYEKFKRAQRLQRVVSRAIRHDHSAWKWLLNRAYGRTGKLRAELMQSVCVDPTSPRQRRLITSLGRSRPPVWTPELTALVTSGISRKGKAISQSAVETPPKIVERDDPDRVRLLGGLPLRLRANIHKRWHREQASKVMPPIQVAVQDGLTPRSDPASLHRSGVRAIGMQDSGIMEELESISGNLYTPPTLTRRQRCSGYVDAPLQDKEGCLGTLPPNTPLSRRFLRRRFQQLLHEIPILTYAVPQAPSNPSLGSDVHKSGRYIVSSSLCSRSNTRETIQKPARLGEADASSVAWLEHCESQKRQTTQKITSNSRKANDKHVNQGSGKSKIQ
ncbi:hypothetical protein K474DRAFT_314268 [Panus rudis PR-1116 ss-1]|nr:hypothetical protein K474DRAFT_314268 [Panus rudis PR-1116 ss-1]